MATYYIDAQRGSDANSGRSPEQAWQTLQSVYNRVFEPGTRLLFRAGCTWEGQLRPRGSGTEDAPIVIDMYGEGAKPHIAGCGLSDSGIDAGFHERPDHRSQNATVYLYNQEYIEINNLQISNYEPNADKKVFLRRGILVQGDRSDDGYLDHIYIRNCDIHDVSGNFYFGLEMHTAGGIIFMIVEGEHPTAFRDVRIENNTLYNVNRMGIDFKSAWRNRGAYYPTDPGKSEAGTGDWFPHLGVVIRGNRLDNIGGDGIVVAETAGALVEWNRCSRFNMRGIGGPAAGVWCLNTDDSVFRFNEVTDGHFTCTDSQAFDIDWNNKRTIYEYNYSSNNGGGFMLICCPAGVNDSFNFGGIVRYNISQNDRRNTLIIQGNVGDPGVQEVAADEPLRPRIYNNLFFIDDQENPVDVIHDNFWWGHSRGYDFSNNIFFAAKGTRAHFTNLLSRNGEAVVHAEGNLFCGEFDFDDAQTHPLNDRKKNFFDQSPGLLAAGMAADMPEAWAYRLRTGAFAAAAGVCIAENGGRDFFGSPLPETKPAIGPCQTTDDGVFCSRNLATGKKITLSSAKTPAQRGYINDNKAYTVWEGADLAAQSVRIDLEREYAIGAMRLRLEPVQMENSGDPEQHTLRVALLASRDDQTYSPVLPESVCLLDTQDNAASVTLYPEALKARYLRLAFAQGYPAMLGEWEIWEAVEKRPAPSTAPCARLPEDGAEEVNPARMCRFSWKPCRDAAMYELLLATEPDFSGELIRKQTFEPETALPARTLAPGTHYYWKVLARTATRFDRMAAPSEAAESEVRSFQTKTRTQTASDWAEGGVAEASSFADVPGVSVQAAIDGTAESHWEPEQTPAWYRLDLRERAAVREIALTAKKGVPSTQTLEVQASFDGERFDTIVPQKTVVFCEENEFTVHFTFDSPENARYLRLRYPKAETPPTLTRLVVEAVPARGNVPQEAVALTINHEPVDHVFVRCGDVAYTRAAVLPHRANSAEVVCRVVEGQEHIHLSASQVWPQDYQVRGLTAGQARIEVASTTHDWHQSVEVTVTEDEG